MLRNLFRKNAIKEQYQVKYMKEKKDGTENKRLYYHWVDSSKREKVRKFFFDLLEMDEEWQENIDFYERNEQTFYTLIHHTETEESLIEDVGIQVSDPEFFDLQKAVFQNKPNKRNLKTFFRNEAIKELFWPSNTKVAGFF